MTIALDGLHTTPIMHADLFNVVAHLVFAASGIAAAALAQADAGAQGNQAKGTQASQGQPNSLQGFSLNRDKPVRIQSATLEVRDKDKVATFSGDVHLVQGDTDLRCKVLVVYYDNEADKPGTKSTQPGPSGQQQIRRMEAKGSVIVTQKEQVATGDNGEFDMRSNTVSLIGNVVVTKGEDVVKGQRLVVDLTTGVSRVLSSGGERVDMLIKRDARPNANASPSQPPPQPARPSRPN